VILDLIGLIGVGLAIVAIFCVAFRWNVEYQNFKRRLEAQE
jgi:hypothetical protein